MSSLPDIFLHSPFVDYATPFFPVCYTHDEQDYGCTFSRRSSNATQVNGATYLHRRLVWAVTRPLSWSQAHVLAGQRYRLTFTGVSTNSSGVAQQQTSSPGAECHRYGRLRCVRRRRRQLKLTRRTPQTRRQAPSALASFCRSRRRLAPSRMRNLPALISADIPANGANTTGTASNITATTNSTLTTLTNLSLPSSQVTGLPYAANPIPFSPRRMTRRRRLTSLQAASSNQSCGPVHSPTGRGGRHPALRSPPRLCDHPKQLHSEHRHRSADYRP